MTKRGRRCSIFFATLLVAVSLAAVAAGHTDARAMKRQAISPTRFPGLTIKVPDKWSLDESGAGTWWGAELSDGGPPHGSVFFRKTPIVVFDPVLHKGVRLRGSFLGWIAQHPRLKTTAVRRIRLGTLRVAIIDGYVRSADPAASRKGFCGETLSAGPCVPITANKDVEGYVSLALRGGRPKESFRFITASLPGGHNLLIQVSRNPFASGRGFVQRAMNILATIDQS